jgi:3-hydroxyisobutyrate dehydrogenase
MMTRIGFVGLGNMGGPMCANLLRAGHEVKAFDLVEAARTRARHAGAAVVGSAVDAAAGVEYFISMLPASRHVETLYLQPGEDGRRLLDVIAPDTVAIDCSTIAPQSSRRVAAAAGERGIAMLDAPVSGGTAGAEKGTLTFIVGGDPATLERAHHVFDAMGANVFHAGQHGAGQVAKVCNNMLLAIQMTGTAEALALGVANGLDPAVLSQIMRQSSGGNWVLNVYNPYPGVMPDVPASRDYGGGFLVDLMLKDLGLAMEAADATDSATPLGALARNLYRLLKREYDAGSLDFSSIQKLYSKLP